jgi:4-amino-4-deoxy-L-arabinose transferase-like glycosyltransferase
VIAPPTMSGRTRILVNTLVVALLLRLFRLGDPSLWVDEAATWWNSTNAAWTDSLFADANHPPVWWLITRASIAMWGDGEFGLRLPAAILGLLSVVLVYFFGRRILDPDRVPRRAGFSGVDAHGALWVVGFAALNPFWLEYAQEARMYAAVLAESLGLSLLYLRWLDAEPAKGQRRRATLVAYAALATAALYTNYFAVWPIVAHAVHAVLCAWRARRKAGAFSPAPLLVAQAAAAGLFVPWVVHLLHAGPRVASIDPYEPFGRLAHSLWRMGVGPGLLALDRPRIDAGAASMWAEQPVLVVASVLLWVVPIAFGVCSLARDRGALGFVLASVLVPIALVLGVFPWFPLIHEKYLIFLAPFLLVLAVAGARTAPGLLKPVLTGGLVVLHVAGVVAYHLPDESFVQRALNGGHPYGKEQWRDARAWIAARAAVGDVVVVPVPVEPPLLRYAWEYYDRRQIETAYVPAPPASAEEFLGAVPAARSAKRVFLLLSHEALHDRRRWIEGVRLEGPVSVEAMRFPRQWGVEVYQFERR